MGAWGLRPALGKVTDSLAAQRRAGVVSMLHTSLQLDGTFHGGDAMPPVDQSGQRRVRRRRKIGVHLFPNQNQGPILRVSTQK